MAIVKMSHFNLYALESDKRLVLDILEEFGNVHISNFNSDEIVDDSGVFKMSSKDERSSLTEQIHRVESAIEILNNFKNTSKIENLKIPRPKMSFDELKQMGEKLDSDGIISKVFEISNKIENLKSEIEMNEEKVSRLETWRNLSFSSDELSSTSHLNFIIGSIANSQFEKFKEELSNFELVHFEIISESASRKNLLLLSENSEIEDLDLVLRKFGFIRENLDFVERPSVEIAKLEKRSEENKSEIEKLEGELKSMTSSLEDLELKYEYLNQLIRRDEAVDEFLSSEHVLFVEGYVRSDESKEFESAFEKLDGYYLEIKDAEHDDENVPIILENNRFVKPFEQLTEMYSIPKYNEIDPTPFLAPFYWIFFGMMIGDFGYGILMFIGTFIMLKLNLSDKMRNNMLFFNYLSVSAIIWGLIYGSFFGGIIEFPKLIDPAEDYVMVMLISVALGAVVMFFGLGLKGYMSIRDGKALDAVYDVLTWYMALIGAIYWGISSITKIPGGEIAKYVMIIGMIGIVLFTGRDAGSIPARFASGAYNLYGISSWLGDFISFVRLMALGLSGAFIGVAVNLIARTVGGGSIAGIIGAIAIFVIGQVLNLGLSALSAYVHSLRLIFVEFFGKFYEGGGKVFKSMRSSTEYIDIKK